MIVARLSGGLLESFDLDLSRDVLPNLTEDLSHPLSILWAIARAIHKAVIRRATSGHKGSRESKQKGGVVGVVEALSFINRCLHVTHARNDSSGLSETKGQELLKGAGDREKGDSPRYGWEEVLVVEEVSKSSEEVLSCIRYIEVRWTDGSKSNWRSSKGISVSSKESYAKFQDCIGVGRCGQEPGLCMLIRNIFERSLGGGVSAILHLRPSALAAEDAMLNFLCSTGETASFRPSAKEPRYPGMYRYSSEAEGEIYFRWPTRSKPSKDAQRGWGCVNDMRALSPSERQEVDSLLGGALSETTSTGSAASPEVLPVGTRVKARYGWEALWFDAVIKEVRLSEASEPLYVLLYDDGDVEEDVKRRKIRLDGEKQKRELSVGQEVDACCQRHEEKVLPGVVMGEGASDGEYLVRFDLSGYEEVLAEGDASVVEESVPRNRIFGPYSAPVKDHVDIPLHTVPSKSAGKADGQDGSRHARV